MSFSPQGGGGATPPQWSRSEEAIAELTSLRHGEMQSISNRLGRVSNFAWAGAWAALATLAGGALIGGALALIPFLSGHPGPSNHWRLIYYFALGVLVLVLCGSVAGALTSHRERSESIKAIKEDFDQILGSYKPVSGGGQAPATGEPAGELGENGEVGVEPDAGESTDPEGEK